MPMFHFIERDTHTNIRNKKKGQKQCDTIAMTQRTPGSHMDLYLSVRSLQLRNLR